MRVDVTLPSGVSGSLFVRGTGTPIVLVHGQLGDRHVFDRVVDVLDARPTAAIDLPWHGASRAPLDGGVERLSRALLEFVDALGWTRVVAVGHSLGALTVFDAAHAQPERFERVVLVGMPGDLDDDQRAQMRSFAAMFAKPVHEKHAALVASLWYTQRHRDDTPGFLDEQLRRLRANDPAAAAHVCHAIANMPARLSRASPNVSATFVTGRDDLIAPVDAIAPFAAAMNATHVVLEGGHFPFEEKPAAFDDVLRALLVQKR